MKLISEAAHQRQRGCEANGVVNHDLAPSLSALITKQALKKRCLWCASAILILSVARIHFNIFLRHFSDYNISLDISLLTFHNAKHG